MSVSLHTWLVVETNLSDGELLQVAVHREEYLKLQGRILNTYSIQKRQAPF
jgi:hypothetical protein